MDCYAFLTSSVHADIFAVDADFPPLQPPTRHQSIASRVSLDESRRSTPPIPPGFEGQAVNESRRSTPTVPPGLSKPTALPDLDGGSQPSSRPSSRTSMKKIASQVVPALPLRPLTPSTPGTPSKLGTKDDTRLGAEETPSRAQRMAASFSNADPTPATATSLSSVSKVMGSEEKTKLAKGAKSTEATGTATGSEHNDEQTSTARKDGQHGAEVSRRKHPGKLDITAAVGTAEANAASASSSIESGTPSRQQRSVSQTPTASSKVPDSPSGSVSSPAVKSVPRTLRVVQTPKAETPPPAPFAPPAFPVAAGQKLPSRKPSTASINVPGTPSSEHVSISDNVSITSTSLSRANSPPPASTKVGTAPVRARTKNQMKKERQERAKAIEEERAKTEDVVKPAVEETAAQEAIVSRKKKTKREKEPKAKAKVPTAATENVPPASQVETPDLDEVSVEVTSKDEPPPLATTPSKPSTPSKVAPVSQPSAPSPSEPSPPPTPTLTAAQLVTELKASAPILQKCIDSLFRITNSTNAKASQNISAKDLANPASWRSDFKVNLSKNEVDALLRGKIPAVHYGGEDGRNWDRGMVTPSGAHIRALTQELEARFLDLEKAQRDMPEELRFRPSKPQNEMKLPAIDLAALKRQFETAGGRGVNAMEQMVQDGATMKKGAFLVDEASKYINEFVMPPATPPPSAVGARGQQGAGVGAVGIGGHPGASGGEPVVPSLDIVERQLQEARRFAEDRESALRKVMKKNKRTLGLPT